jgi:ABC-type protease/lipase transport system fused ATPase/permease subunit
MILRLPDGYATRIGERGASLSGGQRQRIGLARAVFGNPFLVILDEPNANLDADGENGLAKAIELLRQKQSIVIVVSHRPNALAALNLTMVLYEGKAIAFGPREEVFQRVARSVSARAPTAAAAVRGNAPLAVAGAPQ